MKHLVRLATLTLLIAFGARAHAELLFVTSLTGQQILTADTVTNAVTPVFNTVGQPDSLIFDSTGSNIIYTISEPAKLESLTSALRQTQYLRLVYPSLL